MSQEDQVSRFPRISQAVGITLLLGILNIVSVFLALWAAHILLSIGIKSLFPGVLGYLYILLWLLWFVFPIATIIYGSNIRKRVTGRMEERLVLVGLVLGYAGLALVAAIVFGEVTLLLSSLGCTTSSPCS